MKSAHVQFRSMLLTALIAGLFTVGEAGAQSAPFADLNGDGQIDDVDVALLRNLWGPCPAPCAADLNADGMVDALDLIDMLDAAAVGLPAANANANQKPQGNDDHNPVVREAMPSFLEIPVALPPPPVPRSLNDNGAFGGANVRTLDPVTAQRIAEAELAHEARFGHVQPGPKRVGIVRELAPPVSIAGGDARHDVLEDGERMWTMEIRSPGAFHLRAHIEDVELGRSTLLIYGFLEDGTAVVKGPYSGRGPEEDGDFWSASVPGDVMRIEVVGPDQPQLSIREIVHLDDPMTGPANPAGDEGGVAGALGCHIDVTCSSANSVAKQATGQMNFVSGGEASVCTGTLLNDLDSETVVPHFITAYHCLNTQSEVNTLQVVWFWQTSVCNGTLPNYSTLPSSMGGTLLVTNDTDDGNDMTFIRLTDTLPGGVAFAGWTTASLGDNGYGVHHPGGSFKRYTNFDGGSGVCFDPLDYDYYEITNGAIEGGSSGSGIFNSAGQLSGQLYGFCNQTEDPPCSEQVGATCMYGEFESTWEDTAVGYWLTLGGTLHVDINASPSGNGTAGNPFKFVGQAHSAAWNGVQIKIKPGAYPENITLNKQVTLIANGGVVTIGN